MLFIFILLQIADIFTTLQGLKAGAKEANPLLAWAFDHASPALVMVCAKGVAIALLAIADMDVVTAFACGLYVPVVLNNIRVLRKKKG